MIPSTFGGKIINSELYPGPAGGSILPPGVNQPGALHVSTVVSWSICNDASGLGEVPSGVAITAGCGTESITADLGRLACLAITLQACDLVVPWQQQQECADKEEISATIEHLAS
jgi:hypothetical protein